MRLEEEGWRGDVDPRLEDGTTIEVGSRVWVKHEDSWANVLGYDSEGVDVRIEFDGEQVSAAWQQLYATEQEACGRLKP